MKRLSTFEIWLRRGRIVEEPQLMETKFNPWHDPKNGQFTFAPEDRLAANWRSGGRMSRREVDLHTANAMRMYNIHVSRGMRPEQAAAWAANIEAESKGNYRSSQPGGPGRGLLQWGDGNREKLFQQQYGHPIEESTEAEQLNFRDWELTHTEIRAAKKIAAAKGAGDIASAITIYYLRPENKFRDAADRANIAEAIILAAVRH